MSSSLFSRSGPGSFLRTTRIASGRSSSHGGSPNLARQLVEAGLVDEYRLMIEPILLGGGKSIFPTDGQARPLELVSVKQAKTGVLICTYRPAATPS